MESNTLHKSKSACFYIFRKIPPPPNIGRLRWLNILVSERKHLQLLKEIHLPLLLYERTVICSKNLVSRVSNDLIVVTWGPEKVQLLYVG